MKLQVRLVDNYPDNEELVEVIISCDERGIEITPKGVCDYYGGPPIYIEKYNGKLRVITWGDLETSDPTNITEFELPEIVK